MRSGNPALNANTFQGLQHLLGEDATRMTLTGSAYKTAVLLVLALLSAGWTWNVAFQQGAAAAMPWMFGGLIGGLVLSLFIIFKTGPSVTFLAPAYALAEGLFLGGLSARFEAQYPGIVIQAVGLTFGILAGLLAIYMTGLIKPSENFKLGIVAATMGIMLVYAATILLRLFGLDVPYIHSSGPFGIGFSLFVIVLASLNLVLDFDFIEDGVEAGAPKWMEWYAAFGLMVTLVWLYVEVLRLLAKLQSRD